jgi:hypothetical protein
MTDIARYQGASGDVIALHHDEFARAAAFPATFSVGMLSGWLASVLTARGTAFHP